MARRCCPSPQILDHASDGVDRALTIVGAKYTTARGTAERAVNLIARKLGKRVAPSRTATTMLPGAGIADHEALAIEHARRLNLDVPLPVIRHLITRYAETTPSVIDDHGGAARIHCAALDRHVHHRR